MLTGFTANSVNALPFEMDKIHYAETLRIDGVTPNRGSVRGIVACQRIDIIRGSVHRGRRTLPTTRKPIRKDGDVVMGHGIGHVAWFTIRSRYQVASRC